MRKGLAVAATAVAVSAVAGAAIWLTVETRRNHLVWDHFDVVQAGVLYRSGQLTPDQLVAASRRYRIKTVVNFQVPGAEVDAERKVALSHGMRFVNLPMPGDGFGKKEQFREVLAACDDPDRRPVLIHCARGTCRTGASVALYRFERNGWTLADVSAEMQRQSYRDGWLPGYVFGMVDDRPRDDSYPLIARDAPAPPPEATPHAR